MSLASKGRILYSGMGWTAYRRADSNILGHFALYCSVHTTWFLLEKSRLGGFSLLVRTMWTLRFPIHPWIPRNVFYLCHGVWNQFSCSGMGNVVCVQRERVGPCSLLWKDCPYLWKQFIYSLKENLLHFWCLFVMVRMYNSLLGFGGSLVPTSGPAITHILSAEGSSVTPMAPPSALMTALACSCTWSIAIAEKSHMAWFVYNKCSSLECMCKLGMFLPQCRHVSDGWETIVCSSHCCWRRSTWLVQPVTNGIGRS